MAAISKAFSNAFLTNDHITPIDFDSIDKFQESHSWPLCNDPLYKIQTNVLKDPLIPVIDLASPNARTLISQACETWGMFQVINHGVPSELVKQVEFESRRLFALTTQETCKVLRPDNGATGYGPAVFSQFFDKRMWHEGFTIMGSCVDEAKVLWPHGYERFVDTMDAYQNQMRLLSHNLLRIILEALDVTQEEMNWAISANNSQTAALQLNSYPSCRDPSQAVGLAPHTDTLLLTILNQCGISGLEIFVDGLGWRRVQYVEGAFVVNVGDLLHIFSNAKFPLLTHRSMVNQSEHRISIAYFHGPPVDSSVAPSSKFSTPCFKSLLVKEYLSLKYKNFFESLSLIRA